MYFHVPIRHKMSLKYLRNENYITDKYKLIHFTKKKYNHYGKRHLKMNKFNYIIKIEMNK